MSSIWSFSHSDLPTAMPWAARKVFAMRAADHQRVDAGRPDSPAASILVETLAPPTTAITGRSGFSSALSRCCQFGLHRAAGIGGSRCAIAFGRGMGAVRGREGVVDIKIARARRAALANAGSFFSSPGVEAGVFEQKHVAVLHRADRRFGASPMQSVGEGDRPADRLRRAPAPPACSDIAGTTLPLRPVEVRKHDHACAFVREFAHGRRLARRCAVTSVTLPSFIGTLRSTRTSTRLPLHVQIVERPESHGGRSQINLPIADGGVGHPVREAPLIVVPATLRGRSAVDHLGLVDARRSTTRIVVEVGETAGASTISKNALQLLLGGALHRVVDLP